MDFKGHLEKSWHLTLQFIVPLIFMTLLMVFSSLLTLGILGPVTLAGYMHAVLLLVRDGREPKVQDVFSQMGLFLPLLGFGVVTVIATAVGAMMLILPGILIVLGIVYSCLYMMPLMTDRKLSLTDAVKESFSMALKGDPMEHAIVVILFLGISWVGSFVVIGWLFTQPLATVFLVLVYQERISQMPPPSSGDHPIKQKIDSSAN